MSPVPEDLGERVRARRAALGLTARGLADAAGVHRATVAAIESGAGARPNSVGMVLAALDRIDPVPVVEVAEPDAEVTVEVDTPEGNRLRFTGPPRAAGEAAAWFARLTRGESP